MRDKVLPFFWYAIGKVKFTSQRYIESIAAIPNVSFMLRFKGDIYAIFSCIALRSNIATEKIFTKMREAQEAINSRGSYIIPVSFPKMNEILSLERINLKATISHGEIVSFRNKGERVFMVSSFRKSGRKKSIPFPREKKLLLLIPSWMEYIIKLTVRAPSSCSNNNCKVWTPRWDKRREAC